MRMALEWLLPSHAAAAIGTDSQSLLKAIQSGSADTTDLQTLQQLPTVLPDQSPMPQPAHSSAEL